MPNLAHPVFKAMKANMLLLWLISLLATCLHSFHIGKGFTRCSNHRGLSIARRPSTLLPAKNWKHNNVRETDESMRQSAFTRELALAKLRGTVEGFAKNDFEPYSAFVPQDVMNFVNWTGVSCAKWSVFSNDFHACLFDTFGQLEEDLTPQAVGSFVYGLGSMGAPFQELPPVFLDTVYRLITAQLTAADHKFDGHAASHILMGFAKMQAVWGQVANSTLEMMIAKTAPRMSGQDMSLCLRSLSDLEASWENITLPTIRALTPAFEKVVVAMNATQIGNSMQAVAFMAFDLLVRDPAAPPPPGSAAAMLQERLQHVWKMIKALAQQFRKVGSKGCSYEEYYQVSVFFELLNALPQGKEVLKEAGGKPVLTNPHNFITQNRLHRTLYTSLQQQLGKDFKVMSEFDGLQGPLDMDMLVYRNSTVDAIVRVDVPSKFNLDESTKRMDSLKDFLYKHLHPGIPFLQVPHRVVVLEPELLAGNLARIIVGLPKARKKAALAHEEAEQKERDKAAAAAGH